MNYTIIPRGIRKSITAAAFSDVVRAEVAKFRQSSPQPFSVGDTVFLPTSRKELFGTWEVFDPEELCPTLNGPLPKTAVIKTVIINSDYAHERIFHLGHGGLDDIDNLDQWKAVAAEIIGKSLYWSCHLDISFSWAVAADFLSRESMPKRYKVEFGTREKRFVQAIRLICRKEPPMRLVSNWFSNEEPASYDLQDWCCNNSPDWVQGLAIINAATIMAQSPPEKPTHATEWHE